MEKGRAGQGRGQGETGQGGMGWGTVHEREEGVHYPVCIPIYMKRVRVWKWGVRDKRGDPKGVSVQKG